MLAAPTFGKTVRPTNAFALCGFTGIWMVSIVKHCVLYSGLVLHPFPNALPNTTVALNQNYENETGCLSLSLFCVITLII